MEMKRYGWSSSKQLPDHKYNLPAILEYLPDDSRMIILDAGCGNGFISSEIAKMGHEVYAIDAAEDGIAIASETYRHIQNLKFFVRSVYDENLIALTGGRPFDVVISSEVIEHLYFPQKFLKNMYNVLCPEGCIILTTPYHGYLKNLLISIFNKWDKHFTVHREGGHIKFFSRVTLYEALQKAGFSDCRFRGAGRLPYVWKSMVCKAVK